MMDFNVEEMNFLCIVKGADRADTIKKLRGILPTVGNYDMLQIGKSLLGKLEHITEEAYNEISFDATFEE